MTEPPKKERFRSPVLTFVLLLLVSLGAAVHTSTDSWIPAGPQASHGGYGAGSDWDARMTNGLVMEAYHDQGGLPHWDPYGGTGEPLLADPENVGLHPVFALGLGSGWRAGWQWLATFHVFLLVFGLGLLAREVGVPVLAGAATSLVFLTSYEWVHRLQSGHPTIMGVAVWPLAVALALWALRVGKQGRTPQTALLGAGAGLLLGSAGLAGGHYSMPMGLMLLVWVVWGSGAGKALPLALASLLFVPLLAPEGPASGRVVFEALALILFVVGVVRSPLRKPQLACLAGAACGVVAMAGAKILVGAQATAPLGRLLPWSWAALEAPAPPLTPDNLFYFGRIESYLHLPHPTWWLLALVGALALLVRAPGVGTAVLAFVAAAWTSGAAWRPSLFITLMPGSAAMAEHMRLQHVVLLFPAVGLLSMVVEGGRRFGRPKLASGVSLAVGLAAMGWVHQAPQSRFPAEEVEQVAPATAQLPSTFVDAPDRPVAEAPALGEVRGRTLSFHYGTMQPPGVAGEGLLWVIEDGAFARAPAVTTLTTGLNTWTVVAPANAVVAFGQRDAPGWSCEGAERVLDSDLLSEDYGRIDDADLSRTPDPNNPRPQIIDSGERWVTLKMGPSGRAVCRWSTPGLGVASVVQAVGWLPLLWLGATAWRRRKTPRTPPKKE